MPSPPITMRMHQYGASVRTHVWVRSILYVFFGSIRQAQRRARCYPLIHGPDVADLPLQGLSLVWRENGPYLFPGSLTAASKRGKTYKGIMKRAASATLYHRRIAAAGFAEVYGEGIGEEP